MGTWETFMFINMVDIMIMAVVVLGIVQVNEILVEALGRTSAAVTLKRKKTHLAYVPLPLVFSTSAWNSEAITKVEQLSYCHEAKNRWKG